MCYRAEGRQGKVTFYFENTPDPQDVKAMAEAEGCQNCRILRNLNNLENMDGIEAEVYQDAVEKYIAEKSKHSAGDARFWRNGTAAQGY